MCRHIVAVGDNSGIVAMQRAIQRARIRAFEAAARWPQSLPCGFWAHSSNRWDSWSAQHPPNVELCFGLVVSPIPLEVYIFYF